MGSAENVMKIFYSAWGIVIIASIVLFIQYLRDEYKKPDSKFKKWMNNKKEKKQKRKEKKLKKKLAKDTTKKQIKTYNKKKNAINFDALKFEYSAICSIVNEIAAKENTGKFSMSEVYLIKFNEYYKKKNTYSEKFRCGIYTLDSLACLVKALLAEPLFKEKKAIQNNQKILDYVIEEFKKYSFAYDNAKMSMPKDKEKLKIEMQDNFRLYGDDIFLVALYLIEKFDK